jgi:hypothetical protein
MTRNISGIQIWYRIIKELNKARVDYVLVGAAALVVHGLPRSTLDLDIYVPAEENTLIKLFKIANTLGLESEQLSVLKIRHSPKLFTGQWICFSYKGQDILDVFLANEHDFNKLYKNSERKGDKKISIRVASLHDIAVMKKSSGRPIDLSDIDLIKQLMKYKE